MKTSIGMAMVLVAVVAVSAVGQSSSGQAADHRVQAAGNDWRCCWHEGCWWYWTPANRWLVWNGSAWQPYEQWSSWYAGGTQRGIPYTAGYGSYEGQPAATYAEPAYASPVGGYPASGYGGGYGSRAGSGAGSGYSGYGWSWGPGTAFGRSPGSRF
jgi:hypothetical protein